VTPDRLERVVDTKALPGRRAEPRRVLAVPAIVLSCLRAAWADHRVATRTVYRL